MANAFEIFGSNQGAGEVRAGDMEFVFGQTLERAYRVKGVNRGDGAAHPYDPLGHRAFGLGRRVLGHRRGGGT